MNSHSGSSLTVSAPAKLNLFLKVVGRRADGYHLLQTLMVKLSLADQVEMKIGGRGIQLGEPAPARLNIYPV